jgi:hypothetical protein
LPSLLPGEQVKMQGRPLLKGQIRKIQPLPSVDQFKIAFAQPAIMDTIMRFLFDLEVSEGFVIAIITAGALESMQPPGGSTPRAIGPPLALPLEKKQCRKGAAYGTITLEPGSGERIPSQQVLGNPF